jgi:hypothetical protein
MSKTPGMVAFYSDPTGADAVHRIQADGPLGELSQKLTSAGAVSHTIVPTKTGAVAFVYDEGNRLEGHLKRFGMPFATAKGLGAVVGGNNPADGRAAQRDVIRGATQAPAPAPMPMRMSRKDKLRAGLLKRLKRAIAQKKSNRLRYSSPEGKQNLYGTADHLPPEFSKANGDIPSHIFTGKQFEPEVREQWARTLPAVPYADAHKFLGLDQPWPMHIAPNYGGQPGLIMQLWQHPHIEEHRIAVAPTPEGAGPAAYIDIMRAKKAHRGKGLGASTFATQAKAMSDAGFRRIRLIGARGNSNLGYRYNGYMIWPKFGFDANLFNKTTPKLQRALMRDWPGVTTLQELMHKPGGEQWWATHGESTGMTFDTRPNSPSMEILAKYLERKGMTMPT